MRGCSYHYLEGKKRVNECDYQDEECAYHLSDATAYEHGQLPKFLLVNAKIIL
jgi:hypothetical protein